MIILLFVFFHLFFVKEVSAQVCSGSIVVCDQTQTRLVPTGCLQGASCAPIDDPRYDPNCVECTTETYCEREDTNLCYCFNNCSQSSDCDIYPEEVPRPYISGQCAWTAPASTCPTGQIYCAACESCMPNTYTCDTWAAASCGGAGNGTGDPDNSDPPGNCPAPAVCFAGIENCGVVGRSLVTGTCSSGSLCCGFKDPPPPPPQCPQGAIPGYYEYQQLAGGCYRSAEGTCGGDCTSGCRNECVPGLVPNPLASYGDNSYGNLCICNNCAWDYPPDDGRLNAYFNLQLNPQYITLLANQKIMRVNWAGVGEASQYDIIITPSNIPANPTYCDGTKGCTNYELCPGGNCPNNPYVVDGTTKVSVNANVTSFDFTPPPGFSEFKFHIRAVNTRCNNISNFISIALPSGESQALVFSDPEGNATFNQITKRCEDPEYLGGGSIDSLKPAASSSWSLTVTDAVYNKTMQILNNRLYDSRTIRAPHWPGPPASINGLGLVLNYANVSVNLGNQSRKVIGCTCPDDCTYTDIYTPFPYRNGNRPQNLVFYVTSVPQADGWWQAQNGNIFAGASEGDAIVSDVPAEMGLCVAPACSPYLITENADGDNSSAGIPVTGGGEVDANGFTTRASGTIAAKGADLSTAENYDFFYRRFKMPSSPQDNFISSSASKPAGPPPQGQAAFFNDGNLTIDSEWQVSSSESITVFVKGDLLIENPNNIAQLITVDEGGFLAFIVSGNITIDDSVGQPDLTTTTPNLEGMYIASGTLTIASNGGGDQEKRFFGAGSFVGHGSVVLQRSLTKQKNAELPVEVFTYRPDLAVNSPEAMRYPRMIWQEVN